MKNKILALILVTFILIGLFFTGCVKEDNYDENKKLEIYQINTELIYPKYDKIYENKGILVFENLISFNKTYQQLDSMNNLYQNKISNIFINLSDKESINLSNNTNINYNLIYEEFEKTLNFKSLRNKIQKDIDEYNKIYNQEGIYNPDNHFISDITLRTRMFAKIKKRTILLLFLYRSN